MGLHDEGITYKQYAEERIASMRTVIERRADIPDILKKIAENIPQQMISGPPFCIFQYVTSVTHGHDVEIGFPVSQPYNASDMRTRTIPKLEVLSLKHTGPLETLPESYGRLYRTAYSYGLISDEFGREIYIDWENSTSKTTELQFVIHNWHELLAANLERILDNDTAKNLMEPTRDITIESGVTERFTITKTIIKRLEGIVNDEQRYDILSRCAHKFPQSQIDKLKQTYQEAYAHTGNASAAIDAVLEFMGNDPGWGEKPERKGNVIYSSKAPRDPQSFEQAETDEEKRKAYCFCPLIRDHLDKGMPVTFCYCGAGWYRQQWEGALGRPVRIEIVKSLLKGDDRCTFAIYLPDNL